MREVNLLDYTGSISPKYVEIPQPMKILHSTTELKKELQGKSVFTVIRSIQDFREFLIKYELTGDTTYVKFYDSNVWIGTGEKAVPDYVTPDGQVMWKLDKEDKVILTDDCYVQLFWILTARTSYLLFTSSGVFSANLRVWKFTAGVRGNFQRPLEINGTLSSKSLMTKEGYANKLQKILQKKKSSVLNTRLFYLIFTQNSPYFLKPHEAIKAVYGNSIRLRDRDKLLQSPAFLRTFLKEMSTLMPGLKDDFVKYYPGQKMASMAEQIFVKSLDKGSTQEQIDSYNLIYSIRESEQGIPATKVPLIGNQSSAQNTLPSSEQAMEIFEEADSLITDNAANSKEETDAEKKAVLDDLRTETNALNYVNDTNIIQ